MAPSYEESIEYIENLYRLPFIPAATAGLRRAAFLLSQLSNPHLAFRSVHVAGSSGKGSTATMIGAMLEEAGHRTGYFRSPHLVSYTERVSVNNRDIAPALWAQHMGRIIPIAEGMRLGSYPGYDLGRPTLFEILFALGALHFAEEGIAWAAMETGLGGRLDATNLLQSDISVITNISLEHTQILGSTVTAIAHEKAAIIKPNTAAVLGTQDPETLSVVEARARAMGASLVVVGRDIQVASDRMTGETVFSAPSTELRIHRGRDAVYQTANAATAFGAALALRERGVVLDDQAIRRGIERARIPGRFECISGHPPVILDGAHHAAAMRVLAESLRAQELGPLTLLFAAMEDKDIESMADAMRGLVDDVIVTTVPGSERTSSPHRAAQAFRALAISVRAIDDPAEALEEARRHAAGRTLLVTGSLYLVGQVRQQLLTVSE